jgi:predicted component of type VI protein secretion system
MEQGRLMKLSLVVLTPGKGEGKVIPITLAQFLIGRDPQCQLRPASPVISKRHCALLVRDQQVFLRDFDSTNGTFLNDEPIKGEVELHNGDRLKCGPLAFAVQIEVGASVSQPTPPPPMKAPANKAAEAKPAAAKPAPAKLPTADADPEATVHASEAPASEDESIADMLLALGDDGPTGNAVVPEGSTIMDIPVPPAGEGDPNAPPKKEDKMGQAKTQQASTSHAAKAILDKYMKRPRT